MPALAAHYFFGQEVMSALPHNLQTRIVSNQKAYDLGLQGPDIFFAYKPLSSNKVINYGSLLHKEENEAFIQKAVHMIRQSGDATIAAYLMGVLCHFALDRACHPFIESKGQTYEEHFALETAFDCKILELAGEDALRFKRYAIIPVDLKVCRSLSAVYPQMDSRQIRQAVRSMRWYNKLLYSPRGIKLKPIRYAEKRLTGANAFSALAVSKGIIGSFPKDINQLLERYNHAVAAAAEELCTASGLAT